MKLTGETLAILSAIFIGIAIPILSVTSKEIGTFQTAAY